ncbi:MAG: magnesium and cobalt transport protein CorA [Holophagaceae bacterium]|nr:magnesium and cobalt transport protein CorA [Holophagaceae bacterium]
MSRVVNSVAYRNGNRLADISLPDISEVIKGPNTFVWLGLHESDASVLLQIQEEFSLHDLAIEDARKAHQRSKIETYGDSLFIVVKTAQLETGNHTADGLREHSEAAGRNCTIEYGETHFFVGMNFLVSVRHGNAQGYADVRKRCEAKPEMLAKGPAFALYAVMDFIVDNYQPIVEQLSGEFEGLEVDIFKGQFDQLSIERLYELKIKLLQLRQAALPVEDICLQLMRLHPEIIHKDLRAYFRDIHDHVARTIETLDSLREMLTTAMSVNLALVSVRQNEIVKRLAGWGAILAVPTVVFSLYGMNFNNMPELKWHYAYPVMLLCTLAVCGVFYQKLKSSGWL